MPDNVGMQYVTSRPGTTPVVLDSPHSGTWYPDDFGHACDLAVLRRAEDTHVEKLYDFAADLGVAWIEAHFPRSYVDVNRSLREIDLELIEGAWPDPVEAGSKVRLGKGLIWRCTDEGIPIYQRRLSVDEVRRRLELCWHPYHREVQAAIDAAHARHGYSLHINCHSMPSVAAPYATEFPGEAHADIVLGDRDGTTAAPFVTAAVAEFLAGRGYDVAINHPYKGVELVRRYGRPPEHRHSIQLEVNRRLYMDEKTLALHDGFARLRADLRALVEQLLRLDPRSL